MTAHKEGDIKKLMNDMHFVHCEEDFLSSSYETNDVANAGLCKGKSDSSISSSNNRTDIKIANNAENHPSNLSSNTLDTLFRSIISEEI